MNDVEYSIEPNGPISLYRERAARLLQVSVNRAVKIEGLTKRQAQNAKAELAPFCDFPLRIRSEPV